MSMDVRDLERAVRNTNDNICYLSKKVNELVSVQKEQNELMRQLLESLKK